MPKRILVVEDEGISAVHLQAKVESLGYQCAGVAYSGEEAIAKAREARPDLVLMDIKLTGELDGIQAGNRIQKDFGIPVVYLTAFSDEETVARARASAPFGYLIKPVQENALRTTIEMALEKHHLQKQLEESNRDLERFAAVAAHDLKAPSRTVYLFLNLLLKEFGIKLDPKAHEYIHFAQDAAKKMQALVDDLLAYSQLTRKPAPLETVNLNELFAEVIKELKPDIDERRASLKIAELPSVRGNQMQLRRLVENLLCNALKYNKNIPEIMVFSKVEGDKVVVSVRDNGIGIDKDDSEKIFEIFQRLHADSEFPGTGVGLASCKRIVELHGGRIWVDSTPGAGSTFSFTLPVVNTLRVLVADDAPDIQIFAGEMLRGSGAQVDIAKNGEEAIRFVREGRQYDVILMDVQMPGCDGVQATQEIRKLGFQGTIAFTGLRRNGDGECFWAVGFDDYVDKNAMVEEVAGIVERHHRKKAG
jgi:two-component system sensor histidine kinase/response regulator